MAKTVPCPICGKPVALEDPNMPFCSDRCRLLDLGNWASDVYVIPGSAKPNDLELDEMEESQRPPIDSPEGPFQ